MILFTAIIVFLFELFVLSKDDFVLLRKNVSVAAIFDTVFFAGLGGLFVSRLFYALIHGSATFFNPLVFFVIPYFPGLSAAGFLVGSCLVFYMLTMRQKMPVGRLFDIASFSFLFAFAWFFSLSAIFSLVGKVLIQGVVNAIASFALILLYQLLFKKIFAKSTWPDGVLSMVVMGTLTLFMLIQECVAARFAVLPKEFPYFLFFLFVLFFSFLIRILRRETR